MKRKFFIIFALVLVFSAIMVISSSAAASFIVSGSSSLTFEALYHASTPIAGYLDPNFAYPISNLYKGSVEKVDDGSLIREFEVKNYSPDNPRQDNWIVFTPNRLVLSREEDVCLSFGQICTEGSSYYVYGTDYYTQIAVNSPNNTERAYIKLEQPSCVANVIVPKGYEVVVYVVVKANVSVGKDLLLRFSATEVPVNEVDPALLSLSNSFTNSNSLTQYSYDQGFYDGKNSCTVSHTTIRDDAYALGQDDCEATHKALVDAAFAQSESVLESFSNLFFEKKMVKGQPEYSGIIGGIYQAYLDVSTGISLFGISLNTVLITLLVLVVLGVGIKFVLSVI